jgi:CMP-N,N'-diacetyllegionaminic acid synthase
VSDLFVLALIPARGGSKGVPRKNLREIAGRSLVLRAVDAALASKYVSTIHVSTDDVEIAEHVRRVGPYVEFLRGAEASTDDARDEQVVAFVLDEYVKRGQRFDYLAYVRPTAPCREEGLLDRAFEILLSNPRARSLKGISVARQHPYKMWWQTEDGLLSPVLPQLHVEKEGVVDLPRQQLPVVFASSAAIDIVSVPDFLRDGYIHTDRILGFELNSNDDLDVDTEEDLRMAELKEKSRGMER